MRECFSQVHTVEHIKDDGTVQDSGYRTIGHVKKEGTVQKAHKIGKDITYNLRKL